jgi:protein-disulfide isomerase
MKKKYMIPTIKTKDVTGTNEMLQSSIRISNTPTNIVNAKEETRWYTSDYSVWDDDAESIE